MRPNLNVNIKQILQSTRDFLRTNKDGDALVFAFRTLKSIADTLCDGEEGSLADVVPYVLNSMNDKDLASSAMSALASISYVSCLYKSLFFEYLVVLNLDLASFLSSDK